MLPRVVETITRYNMFPPGARVGVAVSGGADSVCLLHVLMELAPRWNLRLSVLHLDHGLRGPASAADAAFVAEIAANLGLPFHGDKADLAGIAGNVEHAAREARLAFFRRFLNQGLLDRVATGHTRSDQAETVLFRILRGAASAGLAGIRPVTTGGLVRPLIEIDRRGVLDYLLSREIGWREDATNASLEFARNRIRHELLPQLARDWNPNIGETLAQTAEWAADEEAYWDGELERLSAACLVARPPVVLVRCDALNALPRAAARRLIRRAIEGAKGDLHSIGFAHIGGILDMAAGSQGHGRMQAPGLDIFRSFEWMRIAPPGLDSLENRNYRLPLAAPGIVKLPSSGSELHLELIEKEEGTDLPDCGYNGSVACLDWERISGALEVRNWRPGDRYHPAGHTGEEKIKALFQQARIPLWERRGWPIIVDGEAVVWARRFGPATRYAAGPQTRTVLAIRETAG